MSTAIHNVIHISRPFGEGYARTLPIKTFHSGRDSAAAARAARASICTAIRTKAAGVKWPIDGGTAPAASPFPHFFTGTFQTATLEFFPLERRQ